MHNRIFAGSAYVMAMAAVLGLILLPATSVQAAAKATRPAGGQPLGLTPPAANALERDSFEPPVSYARANYRWPYATGPHYGEVEVSRLNDAGVLRTAVGSFDMTRGAPAFPSELRSPLRFGQLASQYFVLVMDPEVITSGGFERLQETIVSQGGAIVQDMAVSSFIVRLNQASYDLSRGFPGVLALEPYHAAFKLAPTIGRSPLPDPVKALGDVYDLDIMIFPGEDAGAVALALNGMGGKVLSVAPDLVRAEVHQRRLGDVAAIEAVKQVHEHLPLYALAEETTTTVQTGAFNSGAKPFHDVFINGGGLRGTCSSTTGQGCQTALDCPGVETCVGAGSPQTLMIIDSGVQLDAGDLSDTRTNAGTAGAAHRKVQVYSPTSIFTGGGQGDALGCDAPASGGFTHGHVVASTALGNGTVVPVRYGAGFLKEDDTQVVRPIDGLAPRARLVVYDALVTPLSGSCSDPLNAGLSVGDIYTGEASNTSLEVSYHTHGARTVNFSWGTRNNPNYGTNATRIDDFLANAAHLDSLVVLSAGNDGQDLNPTDSVPDPGSISDPATSKNALVVGASANANEPVSPNGVPAQNTRAGFSSVGPATVASQRISPQVMAPGTDLGAFPGNMGFDSEFACRSNDNTQTNPVECDVSQGSSGTSFASPAVAGAVMLVRDYFAQGFYPDGTSANSGNAGDQVAAVSGALLKAILVGSTHFMTKSTFNNPTNEVAYAEQLLSQQFRFNREQGYGRIQLNNVLPLQNYNPTPLGLIVADGGITGGKNSTSLSGDINLSASETDTTTFTVCDDSKELRVALAWIEPSGDSSTKNLDLELVAPSGRVYVGNLFTDDVNRNGSVDNGTENCPATVFTGNVVDNKDQSPWSLPIVNPGVGNCVNSASNFEAYRDDFNPTEAIFLSPDARLNGPNACSGDQARPCVTNANCTGVGTCTANSGVDKQTETGTWTLRVKTGTPNTGGTQRYAVAIAGGVCQQSSVQFDQGTYVCNESAVVIISEFNEGVDPVGSISDAEAQSRTIVEVIHKGTDGILGTADDCIVDTEDSTSLNAFTFTHVGARYTSSPIPLTDGTAAEAHNGALDVASGEVIRVTYVDETSGASDPNKRRTNTANVNCQPSIQVGAIRFTQFGRDTAALIEGGCERDARGLFTFGFADNYMDDGERVAFRLVFESTENGVDLTDVDASLKCVFVDADSPIDCAPGTTQCADPNRANNTRCDTTTPGPKRMTVLDSPKNIGDLPAGQTGTVAFQVQMEAFTGTCPGAPPNGSASSCPKVEMVIGLSSSKAGKRVETLLVSRHTLNTDESSLFYSTDFAAGGVEVRDYPASFFHENNPPSNEQADNPTTSPNDFLADYRFDTISWASLTATGRNTGIQAPWNFETNNGGFTVGLNNTTTSNLVSEIISLWGEDKDFDNTLDYHCSNNVNIFCTGPGDTGPCSGNTCISDEDRDPQNLVLDNNWSTDGGCGWQTTTAPGVPGGIWHTGRVDAPGPPNCLVSGASPGACQNYETLGGTTNVKRWWEMLLTPALQKVNQCTTVGGLPASCGGRLDSPEEPIFQVQFMAWDWNMALDLKDRTAAIFYELDTDTTKIAPSDLINDAVIYNALFGPQGPITPGNAPLSGGYQVFAPIATGCTSNCASTNGTVGSNRVGRNPCYFETNPVVAPFRYAEPKDDDVDNDATAPTDEFVMPNGPIRNYDMQTANGQDMRLNTLEDFWGVPSGETFQASLGFRLREGDATVGASGTSFGVSVDDMVIQWREFQLVGDNTDCANTTTGGSCATVEMDSSRLFEGSPLLTVTVTDTSPYGMTAPANKNDCNDDGDFTDVAVTPTPTCPAPCSDDTDCDNNGTTDVTVSVTSDAELTGEFLVLNRVGASNSYRGSVAVSTASNLPGVLFVSQLGTGNPVATARYQDRWDGTSSGDKCENDAEPARQGEVTATASLFLQTGNVTVTKFRINDVSGTGSPALPAGQDGDGYPDTGETIDVFITVSNKTGRDLSNLVAQLSSNDPKIECVLSSLATIGSLPAASSVESAVPFRLKVNSLADRGGTNPVATCTASSCSNFAGSCTLATDCQKTVSDIYAALASVTMSSDQFDVIINPQTIPLDLDLNSNNVIANTTSFTEGFETGFGNFQFLNIDDNKGNNTLSNGYRCQYNDPDFPNAFSYGDANCYLGFAGGQSPVNDWHPHTTAAVDAGRAFLGNNSMHYGKHTPGNPGLDTTGLSQLDGLRTKAGINLAARVCQALQGGQVKSCNSAADCIAPASACISASPELSFKHQVSSIDGRSTNCPDDEAVDRAIVAAQLTTSAIWQKVFPFENIYDVQGENVFSNCVFDPIDDGNDEDDFFDPTDPNRLYGPSTGCFPEFIWGFLGDTDAPFNVTNIGRASDGPGLQGSIGTGTWVQSRFDLSRFRGRSIRIRFTYTSIKAADAVSAEAFFMWNPRPDDDGWYIDDVRMTQTLGASAATVSLDAAAPAAAGCGNTCNTLTASVGASITGGPPFTDPLTSPTPAKLVTVSAQASSADRCVNGGLEFQFWHDVNANGTLSTADGDVVLRDFSVNPIYEEAPNLSRRYGVIVKCVAPPGGANACTGSSDTTQVNVTCPTDFQCSNDAAINCTGPGDTGPCGGNACVGGGYAPNGLRFANKTTLFWAPPQRVDVIRGRLFGNAVLDDLLDAPAGDYTGTVESCLCNADAATTPFSQCTDPGANPGQGAVLYYLGKNIDPSCNYTPTWGERNPKQRPGASTEEILVLPIDSEINECN